MKITDIVMRSHKDTEEGKRLFAICDVVLEDKLIIHGIKIVNTIENKLIVCFPSKKVNEKFKDIVHPIDKEFRKSFDKEIIEFYLKNRGN